MARPEKIYLMPVGFDSPALLDKISSGVKDAFGLPVERLPPSPIPEFAYNEGRGQYHSTSILRVLRLHIPADALRVLAITDVDLYVPQLNFVFGEAAIDGQVSVISLYRLRPEFYGRPHDERLFTERAIKEAIHELGHTFGLRHSTNPRCVMFFSNSIEDTDRKSAQFLGDSAESLRIKLRSLKAAA